MEARVESVGARIRRLRIEQGRSLRDIEGPGADHAHISRVESGQRRATEPFLRTVARSLGVTVDYLRQGEEWDAGSERRAALADLELRLRLAGDGEDKVVEQLRTLHARAYAEGDVEVARRSRILIGCSASHRGDHPVAIRELAGVVQRGGISPLTDPDVYVSLAASLTAVGRADEALAVLESCVEEAERAGDDIAFVRFATVASYASVDAGDMRQARRFVACAASRADAVNELNSTMRIYWARARLAWAERDWACGRTYAARAIALCEVVQNRRGLVRLHIIRAEIGVMSGELDACRAAVEQARQCLSVDSHPQDVACVRYLEAFVAAANGQHERSIRLAEESVALLNEDPACQARAKWALAHALAAAGRQEEAAVAYEDAYELVLIERRFIAEFLRDWAATLLELGRTDEAARVFMAAVDEGSLTSADLR